MKPMQLWIDFVLTLFDAGSLLLDGTWPLVSLGLGSVVLQSLQYAAKGQGLLAGLAILLSAMVIDRIVQGSFNNRK